MPRKHLVASQTNRKQQTQAKIWQKLAREIRAAVKVGGPNIEANPRLKAAVQKALANNLSRESIDKNINGLNKDQDQLETLEYEAYGPNGLQLIIHVLTSNPNRSASNLRGYLSKLGGNMAKQNSVKIFFENKGLIIVIKKPNVTLDSLMELTMEYNILDIIEQDDSFEIYTSPEDFYKTLEMLKENKVEIFHNDLRLFSTQPIDTLEPRVSEKLENFINSCDDDEDIQWVVTNYEEK